MKKYTWAPLLLFFLLAVLTAVIDSYVHRGLSIVVFSFGMAGLGFWVGYDSGYGAGYSAGYRDKQDEVEKQAEQTESQAKGIGEYVPPGDPSIDETQDYARQMGLMPKPSNEGGENIG